MDGPKSSPCPITVSLLKDVVYQNLGPEVQIPPEFSSFEIHKKQRMKVSRKLKGDKLVS